MTKEPKIPEQEFERIITDIATMADNPDTTITLQMVKDIIEQYSTLIGNQREYIGQLETLLKYKELDSDE